MNVEFHHKATAEVRAAVAFYETEQVGLGRDLWDEIQATRGGPACFKLGAKHRKLQHGR